MELLNRKIEYCRRVLTTFFLWVLGPRFLYEQTVQKYSIENNDQIVNNKTEQKTTNRSL